MLATGAAGAPTMLVGAAEDAPKQYDLLSALAKTDLARLAGFRAIRVTARWTPGRSRPGEREMRSLRNAVDAAGLRGLKVLVAISSSGSRTTPRTPAQRRQFAAYAAALAEELPEVGHIVVGNEPNLNRFWMPQFTRSGGNAAAPAYTALLAATYDALKGVRRDIVVIGGAISSHGGDDPNAPRQTQSPTGFIPAMGAAYRSLRRKEPIMDAFALHPYLLSSHRPPTVRHPRSTTVTIADYQKLVRLLGRAFDGTAQPGTELPIYYAEYGVQSRIPRRKHRLYANRRARAARDAVSERTQGRYYRQALALVACQPTVAGFFVFHVQDERDLRRWQSGVYYADDTPKSSLRLVRAAISKLHAGKLTRCGAGAGHR